MGDRRDGVEDVEHQLIQSLRGTELQVSALTSLLEATTTDRRKRWLIDNSAVEKPIEGRELQRLVRLANRYADKLRDARVAFVVLGAAPHAAGLRPEPIAAFLPFHFRKFRCAEEAKRWLAEPTDRAQT